MQKSVPSTLARQMSFLSPMNRLFQQICEHDDQKIAPSVTNAVLLLSCSLLPPLARAGAASLLPCPRTFPNELCVICPKLNTVVSVLWSQWPVMDECE
jgi:hypothetical protein